MTAPACCRRFAPWPRIATAASGRAARAAGWIASTRAAAALSQLPAFAAGRQPARRSGAGAADRPPGHPVGGYLGRLEPPPGRQRSLRAGLLGDGEGHASLAGRIVQALFEASDGRIWVGTQQGDLAIIDPATDKGCFLDTRGRRQPGRGVQSRRGVGDANVGRPILGIDLYDGRRRSPGAATAARSAQASGLAGNEVTA
jgi:hypothetical protein